MADRDTPIALAQAAGAPRRGADLNGRTAEDASRALKPLGLVPNDPGLRRQLVTARTRPRPRLAVPGPWSRYRSGRWAEMGRARSDTAGVVDPDSEVRLTAAESRSYVGVLRP